MRLARIIAGWTLAIAAALIAFAYICDSIYVHHQMAGSNSSAALGSVQYYPAAQQKNGNLEIYYESPQTETCVHALFPHAGYRPCWYAQRKTVRLMGWSAAPDNRECGSLAAHSPVFLSRRAADRIWWCEGISKEAT